MKNGVVKGLLIALGIVALLVGFTAAGNYICNLKLRNYIHSFEPVQYGADRVVPTFKDGHYEVVSEDELDIMYITDIHMGGGLWTYKRDKKAIYEVITMMQAEKPDIVVLGGDNTYAILTIGYNGGGTFNNKMVARTVLEIFENEQVYFTTAFGNHDAEAIDYYNRSDIAELYMDKSYQYCFFNSEYTDADADTVPSVSNQCIVVRNPEGSIEKLLFILDTNDYKKPRFINSMTCVYDTIHEGQVKWAQDLIKEYSLKEGLPVGEYLKSLVFCHIPTGEYECAFEDLKSGNPAQTEFIEGWWDEKMIFYGGFEENDEDPSDSDMLFEVLSGEMNSLQGIICGHDHVNNNIVKYKGVYLCYGMSIDNIAYGNSMSNSGLQRGATVIFLRKDGTVDIHLKNAYKDYDCNRNQYDDIYIDHAMYPDRFVTFE